MVDLNLRISRTTQPYLFQNSSILTDLPVEDLNLLHSSAKPESKLRGEILFRQGTFPTGVYWLLTGKAKIYQETSSGQRQTMYIYSDGDLIAHRQFIAGAAHPVSAMLLEDATVMLIPGDTFRGLLHTSPFFTRNMLTGLAREFTVWMNRMTVFTQFPMRQRLILALLILYEQYLLSGSPQGIITMTRTDLAEHVGASLETVVRALNILKSKNLVEIKGRSILLPDPGKLVDILEEEM